MSGSPSPSLSRKLSSMDWSWDEFDPITDPSRSPSPPCPTLSFLFWFPSKPIMTGAAIFRSWDILEASIPLVAPTASSIFCCFPPKTCCSIPDPSLIRFPRSPPPPRLLRIEPSCFCSSRALFRSAAPSGLLAFLFIPPRIIGSPVLRAVLIFSGSSPSCPLAFCTNVLPFSVSKKSSIEAISVYELNSH